MRVIINDFAINEEIRNNSVRVVSAKGEQLGIMTSKEARELAKNEGLDLVCVSPNAEPPVCKIINYGKFKYELERKEKEAKKKQKTMELKEIRLSPNIDTNDIQTKLEQAKKFLEKGHKLKVVLRFRGREMSHMQQTRHILDDFVIALKDISTADNNPKMEGRSLTVVLSKKQ